MPLRPNDRAEFARVLNGVSAMYRVELSPDVVELWWAVLADYDMAAIKQALTKHLRNPDTGQFMPKPADVVKFMAGTTQDAALLSWAKVHRAVRQVGSYSDVVFDDPIIHAVLQDMGGWIKLCEMLETDVPFRAKEFENRYRAYARNQERPQCLPILTGRANLHNGAHGHALTMPMLIGDEIKCREMLGHAEEQPVVRLRAIR